MNQLNNQKGQSTIEFIFSISFALFLIIYTVKVALNYTSGYLAHYATYMASRAYLTFEGNGNEAGAILAVRETYASTKIEAYNPNLEANDTTLRVLDGSASPQQVILSGVIFDWETSFSTSGMFGGNQPLEMRSESYLGREPDRKSCVVQTCTAARDSSGACGRAFTLVDNGC